MGVPPVCSSIARLQTGAGPIHEPDFDRGSGQERHGGQHQDGVIAGEVESRAKPREMKKREAPMRGPADCLILRVICISYCSLQLRILRITQGDALLDPMDDHQVAMQIKDVGAGVRAGDSPSKWIADPGAVVGSNPLLQEFRQLPGGDVAIRRILWRKPGPMVSPECAGTTGLPSWCRGK